MKISELFEDTTAKYKIELLLPFSCEQNVGVLLADKDKVKPIIKEINNVTNTKTKIDVENQHDGFTIYCTLTPEHFYDELKIKPAIIKILDNYIDVHQGIMLDKENERVRLKWTGDLPQLPYPLNHSDIELIGQRPWGHLTLKGINNIIGNKCSYVNLNYADKLTGNVLGLLSLKERNITISQDLDPAFNKPWFKILNNHYHDADVFACKEELVSAGLKEYAKF